MSAAWIVALVAVSGGAGTGGCGGSSGDRTTLTAGGVEIAVIDRPAVVRGSGPGTGTGTRTGTRTGTDGRALTVLFLHGASYTADVWDRLGLLDAVARHGERAVAVDLPGFGRTGATDLSPEAVMSGLMEVLDPVGHGRGVVVVSPAMSGTYSLGYLASGGPMAGYLPVAPVGVEGFDPVSSAGLPPTLVLWGERDRVIDPAEAETLAARFPNARVQILAGAGHAAYEDHPEDFTRSLLGFLDGLRSETGPPGSSGGGPGRASGGG